MARQRRSSREDAQVRTMLAQRSARLIADEGVHDYRRALRKAAERMGISDEALWPDASEVEAAVREHQRLFASGRQPNALNLRREAAAEALAFFSMFEPRLVGPVLDGTADEHTPVTLHLFVDDADAVARFLTDRQIPHRFGERRVRHAADRRIDYPMLSFVADDIDFELIVLPLDRLRETPLDSGGRPLRRATLGALRQLIAQRSI